MVSTDSFLAGSMKLQVLTTRTSASAGSGVNSWPLASSWPIMTSLSTRVLGQPRLTKPNFRSETAGVDHQDIGFGGVGRQLVAPGQQLAHHDFTVNEVFGTAQTDKADFQWCIHAGPGVPGPYFPLNAEGAAAATA